MAGNAHDRKSPLGGVKAFSCPNCGGQVELRAPGQTLAAACIHCGSVIDLKDENFQLIQKAEKKLNYKPIIPLGTRGKLWGKEWEVIGYMVRKAEAFEYYWEEYLLFNPWYGFTWLVNNYGHWSFAEPLVDLPSRTIDSVIKYERQKYRRFSTGKAKVMFVLGEFYWRVKNGDTSFTADYIAPPIMLSFEKDSNGQVWTKGTYIEPKEVREAFGLEQKMPPKLRTGAHQPNKNGDRFRGVIKILIPALILLIALQFMFWKNAGNEVVHRQLFKMAKSDTTLVSEPFELQGVKNIQVWMSTPSLSNNWIEVQGYLHNENSKENYGFKITNEYWSGTDSDGAWSEGSLTGRYFMNRIPEGKYRLVTTMASGTPNYIVDIAVRRDIPFLSNFLILMVLLCLFPLYLFIMGKQFEKARWEEAD